LMHRPIEVEKGADALDLHRAIFTAGTDGAKSERFATLSA